MIRQMQAASIFLLAMLACRTEAFAPSLQLSGFKGIGLRGSVNAARRLPAASVRGAKVNIQAVLDMKQDHAPTAMDWSELGSKPWGSIQTDFMYLAETKDGVWQQGQIKPYGDLSISPRAGVLNYGQGVFEGMKAQRTKQGKIVIFRPDKNARRVRYGCSRICMPELPEEIFMDGVKQAVLANAKWVPPFGQGSLYMRPLIIGSGPICENMRNTLNKKTGLGLAPAPSYSFLVYVAPVGSYFKGNQLSPIKLKVEDTYSRAAKGGIGGVKAVGNYAGSLLPQGLAKKEGFDNVLYLDAAEGKYLEEVGTSNIFLVKGKTIYTPGLTGGGNPEDTILEGVTRDSVIQVAKDAGYEVKTERVPTDMLWEADEAFTVGTAVVVSPIGSVSLNGKVKSWEFPNGAGPATTTVYETLTGIQTGKLPDPYGWTVYLD